MFSIFDHTTNKIIGHCNNINEAASMLNKDNYDIVVSATGIDNGTYIVLSEEDLTITLLSVHTKIEYLYLQFRFGLTCEKTILEYWELIEHDANMLTCGQVIDTDADADAAEKSTRVESISDNKGGFFSFLY